MTLNGEHVKLLVIAAVVACLSQPFHAFAVATAPDLGQATNFSVLGGQTVTNTGPSVVTGNLGVSPGSAVTGFPPGTVVGTIHAADAVALQAQTDLTTAYNNLAGQSCDTVLPANAGGLTLTPGVYCAPTSLGLTGTLTLDAQGDPNAVFVIQVPTALTTASASLVNVINGGQICNVFWQVGSSATFGTGSTFAGNILALTSITVTTGVTLNGRALARNGAVTLDTNAVTICSLTGTAPALDKAFNPDTISGGAVSTLTITLINLDPAIATLTEPLIDTLPPGVAIANPPNVATTCDGVGDPVAVAEGPTVTLPAGRSIPGDGSCTVTVDVTSAAEGSHINSLLAAALVTSNGVNALPATATLTVLGPPISTPIPTLSEWAMIILASILALAGVARIRQSAT